MRILLLVVLIIQLLPFSGCAKNEIEEYAESLPFPQGVCQEAMEIIKPLGNNGMDGNEKTLVGMISILSQEVQLSETVLNFLREIVQDNTVTEGELRKFRDLDGDGLVNFIDPEPLEELVYEVPVDYLNEEMRRDALSCIETDKVKTFQNLSQVVYDHVPHADFPRGKGAYPNAKWNSKYDEGNQPRDPLSYYYSYHEKVQLPPNCNDIALVYDVMADYIIEYTGWDREGEQQGNNGVDCDAFPCILDGTTHVTCIINVNGEEYVAEAVYGILFRLGDNPHYDLSLDKGMGWRDPVQILMVKFDKRYFCTIYEKNPIKTDVDRDK